MVTSAGKAHCTWCGAVITGGRRFCGACGQAVGEDADDGEPRTVFRPVSPQSQKLFKDALDTEPDQSQGLMGKLGSGLATAVGIPLAIVLALISIVISTALPILVVMALIMGPGHTWNIVRAWVPGLGGEEERAACEGFDDWYDVSSARADTVYALIEPVEKGTVVDPAGLREITTDIRGNALAQRLSNPPPEAVKLNFQMVNAFELLMQAATHMANGDFTNLQELDTEYQALAPQVEAEETRVRQACA